MRLSAMSRAARLLASAVLLATAVMPMATTAVVAATLGPNLVQNGSFESPALPADSVSPTKLTSAGALPSWTLSGTVDLVRCAVPASCPATGYPWAAYDGAQSVDLEGTVSGTVIQQIPTIPGHTYTLSFAYMPGPLLTDVESPKVNIQWNGGRVKFALAGRTGGARTWRTATAIGLVATTTSTTLRFSGNAAKRYGFGLDAVSVADEAGPDTPPPTVVPAPELLRAAPSVDGLSSGFTGRILADAGTYQVTFYAGVSCDDIGNGTPALGTASVVSATASAIFQVAIPGSIPGTTPFVAARVTGPASTPGVAGKISDFGSCVVYSPENDTWPRALDITPSGGATSSPTVGNWIDQAGVGRWFKVHVVPGGSVTVDLTNVPADYDIYLFRDIAQTYAQLTSTTDLTELSAQFAGSGFAGSGFAGSGFAGSGFAGSGFAGSGFAGSGFAADVYSGSGFAGSGFAGSGFAGSGFAGSGFAGSGFAGSGFAGSGFAPEAFSAAQVYSLIGWSNNLGLAEEHATVNTWTSTGDYYIRVNGKNGTFSLASPFTLDVTLNSSVCTTVNPIGTKPGPIANNYETVILTNTSRFNGAGTGGMMTALDDLAAATNGVVVDLAGNSRVQALQDQASANAACVYAANLAASAAKDVVDAYRKGNTGTGTKYVVLAGGDAVVPFFRYPDTSSIGPEVNFYPPVLSTSTSEASLRSNYVLGQDAYGSSKTLGIGVIEFPIPQLAVGRLVESPTQIANMVATYLGQSVVSPTSSLVSGYDFVADTATRVKADLDAGTGVTGASLITDYGLPPSDPTSWTADQLRTQWLGTRRDISFLAGHFSASAALAADFASIVTTADLATAAADLSGTVVFSVGCHSGYNVVDEHGVPGVTNIYDWAQAFADQGVTSILGTGYQYGDTDFIEYSERIYADFARELRYGSGAVAIGKALVQAKIQYLKLTFQLGDLHTKSVLETVLYGLPMLGVNMPAGRLPAPDDSSALALTPFTSEPGLTTGLRYHDLNQPTPSVQRTKSLNVDGGGTLTATYYTSPDGLVNAEPGAPAIPLYLAGATAADAGYVLRGVGFRGGGYADSTVVPLTGAPGTELQTAHTSFNSPTFYPARMFRANYFDGLTGGGDTSLLITGAQHRAPTPGTPDVLLRLYGNLNLRLFYSNSTAPGSTSDGLVIYGITSNLQPSGESRITARIVGDPNADVQQAWITYTQPGSGVWQSADLVRDPVDPTLWTITLNVAAGTDFMIQAVNGFGLVSVNDNLNAYYKAGVAAADQATSAILLNGATSGVYGTNSSISATLTSGGNPAAGRQIIFALGPAVRSAITNASGVATASIPLAGAAGSYNLTASFLGDATTMASAANRPFEIQFASSTVTINCPASVEYDGGSQVPCDAAVTGAGGLADTLTVSYSNNIAAGTAAAYASYPGDAAHTGSSGTAQFTIGQATSSTSISCPASEIYTGSPIQPCSANVTGAGTVTGSASVAYTNNVDVGTAGATATYAGDSNHTGSSDSTTFEITKAPSSVTVSCPTTGRVYTGAAIEPCTASFSGAGGLSGSLTPNYSNNINVGTADVTATYAGDGNHSGSSATAHFVIGPATSSLTITCPASRVYTGATIEPCTATVTGAGGLNQSVPVSYGTNLNVGTATASATFDPDANHTGSSDSKTFEITKAPSTTAVTCPAIGQVYTGAAIEPCSASYSGAGGLSGSLTPTYSNNVNVGTANAAATYAGDANHTGSSDSKTFGITKAPSTTTVSCPASVTYDGTAKTPCYATLTGPGLSTTIDVTYSNNVNVGNANAAATYAGDSNHTGSSDSKTFEIVGVALAVTATGLNPTSQYSDSVTLTATVPAGATGSVSFTFNGRSAGSAVISSGSAHVSLRLDGAIIPNGSGSYAASATYLTYTSPPITVVVAREGQKADLQSDGSARLGYTGPQLVPTNTRPTLTASIRQGLDPETDDTERLDFSRASVSAVFQIYPAACGTSCPAAVWTSGNIAIANSSTAGENGVATVVGPKLAQGSYLIVVSVNSNAYILPQVATSTLSVGTPSGTFLSGAGFIATDSTANAPVTSGLFGFSVKNGTPPAGDAVYVYRMRINPGDSTPISLVACTTLGTTCRDVDVIVRSTGITSITPNKSNSYPFVASAVGNALVQFVDAADGTTRYTALEISGATFRLDAYDASSGGSTDKFGLTVYKSGSVYHQAWIPVSGAIPQTGTSATTNQAVLAGGNITVH